MDNQVNALYQAPGSDLAGDGEQVGVQNFKRFSAWGVFGLSVITLGLYPIYWLYSRARKLNEFHQNPLSEPLLLAYVGVSIAILVLSFTEPFVPALGAMSGALDSLSLVNLVLYLMVLFKLRNRLAEVIGGSLGGIMTFFFNVIYLQYKINEAIDAQQQR